VEVRVRVRLWKISGESYIGAVVDDYGMNSKTKEVLESLVNKDVFLYIDDNSIRGKLKQIKVGGKLRYVFIPNSDVERQLLRSLKKKSTVFDVIISSPKAQQSQQPSKEQQSRPTPEEAFEMVSMDYGVNNTAQLFKDLINVLAETSIIQGDLAMISGWFDEIVKKFDLSNKDLYRELHKLASIKTLLEIRQKRLDEIVYKLTDICKSVQPQCNSELAKMLCEALEKLLAQESNPYKLVNILIGRLQGMKTMADILSKSLS
jgi:hypothetical protein